ncbi:MAG TPA: hypothetical protein VKE96_18830 [Vicinamibacterales bacterium]|nr:hypothetical protein [Vicinamibacterales bacterium]
MHEPAELPPPGTGTRPPGLPIEQFVGQLSTSAIASTIGPKVPAIATFANWLESRTDLFGDVQTEVRALLDGWRLAFGDNQGSHANEAVAKVDLTPELLRRWFGDSMLKVPVSIADLQKASIVDLLRLLDYRTTTCRSSRDTFNRRRGTSTASIRARRCTGQNSLECSTRPRLSGRVDGSGSAENAQLPRHSTA